MIARLAVAPRLELLMAMCPQLLPTVYQCSGKPHPGQSRPAVKKALLLVFSCGFKLFRVFELQDFSGPAPGPLSPSGKVRSWGNCKADSEKSKSEFRRGGFSCFKTLDNPPFYESIANKSL